MDEWNNEIQVTWSWTTNTIIWFTIEYKKLIKNLIIKNKKYSSKTKRKKKNKNFQTI